MSKTYTAVQAVIQNSLVHNQETSDQLIPSGTFREHSLENMQPEYDATEDLYRRKDTRDNKSYLADLRSCRTRAWFSVDLETRQVRIATNNCRLRWCPICSSQLSKFRSNSIGDWLKTQPRSRLLTLTLKHSDAPLQHQIKSIYYFFRQLRKTKFFRSVCTGGIWFFQIKRSKKTQQWHPHLHCIITGTWVQHSILSELWKKITGGSFVVDISSIRDKFDTAEYVARYSARPALLRDFSEADQLEIFDALAGKRLCGKWGTGRSCILSSRDKVDVNRFSNIGSWKTVTSRVKLNQYARTIYRCWKTGTSLPKGIDLSCFDRAKDRLFSSDLAKIEYICSFEDLPP